jgi:cytochrome c-type biogenesis protein
VDVGILGAFLGGLLSFLSPCVLPLVPPYLCYIAGLSAEEFAHGERDVLPVVRSAGAFVLGFSTVFVALGATASLIGQTLARHIDTLAVLGGVAIILMGLHFLGVFRIALLYREARLQVGQKPPGLLTGYVLGLAFAFGWTPCIGPVLAAILVVAGATDTAGQGAFLLLVYSLGLGVPFLLAAGFAPAFVGWSRGFRRHLATVEKAMGALLIVSGVLFITGQMSAMSYWLLETFPGLATIG